MPDGDELKLDYKLYKTMYPLLYLRAETLMEMGLPVYEVIVGDEDVKTRKTNKKHKFEPSKLYAIHKTVWRDFLSTPKGELFMIWTRPQTQ